MVINPACTTEIEETACDFFIYNNENLTETGVYEYTFQNQNGCDSIVTLNLTIHPSSSIEINENACDTFIYENEVYTNSGSYQHLIQNQHGCDSIITLNLTINRSSIGELTIFTCDSFPFQNQMIDTTGAYHFTLLNHLGCDSLLTLYATIDPPPTLSLYTSDTLICHGEDILLTMETTAPNFNWNQFQSNDEDFQIASPLESIVYTVTAHSHDDPSCYVHDSVYVEVQPAPNVVFSPSPDFQYIEEGGGKVYFNNLTNNDNGCTFAWHFGDTLCNPALNCSTEHSPTHEYPNIGVYTITLTGTTSNSCQNTFQQEVQIASRPYLYIPSAFSPNNDGLNDYFVVGGSHENLKSYNMAIFDRWGSIIFQSNSVENSWNGNTPNGEPAPAGVYVYKCTIITASGKSKNYVGSVFVMR